MKLAYCDCFSGISGDMFLGALVDAGVPLDHLTAQLKQVEVPEGYEVTAAGVKKGALRATQVDVLAGHSHHHRHYTDIIHMIEESRLAMRIQETALAIFSRLAEAEARVHGTTLEQVHFHEVGAVDSIVDILGAAIGLDFLGIQRLYASPLPVSSGHVQTQHGLLPLPAPATLELMRMARAPIVPSTAGVELVTPTGAAILAALATFEQPAFAVSGVGIGSGKKELPWPNVMRLILGETGQSRVEGLVLIETNIDDMNAEVFGHVMAKLMGLGALDVFFTPIQMKKNRPATMLSVIATKATELALAQVLLRETSSFGLRVQPITRYEAERSVQTVATAYGEVPVKLKILDGQVVQAAPEYDACARIANENGLPLLTVYAAAQAAAAKLIH